MRVTSIVTAVDVGRDLDASFHGFNPPPPPSPIRVYEPLWVAGTIARALFAHRFLSSRNKMLVDAVTSENRWTRSIVV